MNEIRDQLFDGSDITSALRKTLLAPPPIPNWQDVDRLYKLMQKTPEPTKDALKTLWNQELPVGERIEGFVTQLPMDGYISTNLISALHMAMGPTEFPPYKPTAYGEAARILDYELPKRNVRTEQHLIYADALEFLDTVMTECANRGVNLRDRLDAQGIVWIFGTKSTGFDSWDDDTKRQFALYAGREVEADQTKVQANSALNHDEPSTPTLTSDSQKSLREITQDLKDEGIRLNDRTIRRYHLSLRSRGFVILAGVSGTGKTWLAESYATAIGARLHREAVAPNWTSNEDLIGYFNPVSGTYHHTPTSIFIQEAAAEFDRNGEDAQEFHLLLDEMNLARIEHYFATFLSAMEELQRYGRGKIEIAGADPLYLTPNIKLIGTVNIDETTHGFANKVYDRAQTIELLADATDVKNHLGDRPWAGVLFNIWNATQPAAPFAFRVIDDINRYVELAEEEDTPWEEALDEQIEQKILPKVSGNQSGLHAVLGALSLILEENFPLSFDRVEAMKSQHEDIGFVSYFN